MNTDLSTQMLAMNTVQTQNSVQLAVLKQQNDMQTELVNMLTEATRTPPPAPAGQGLRIDKQA